MNEDPSICPLHLQDYVACGCDKPEPALTGELNGDIITELNKVAEYHAKQVVLWKDLLRNSTDGSNTYAKRMIATHEDFSGAIFIAISGLAKGGTESV
jgi:hypothetical protein